MEEIDIPVDLELIQRAIMFNGVHHAIPNDEYLTNNIVHVYFNVFCRNSN